MESKGLSLTVDTAQGIIELALKNGFTRVALEIAQNFEAGGMRGLDNIIWVKILTGSTDTHFVSLKYSFCS